MICFTTDRQTVNNTAGADLFLKYAGLFCLFIYLFSYLVVGNDFTDADAELLAKVIQVIEIRVHFFFI